MTSNSRWLGLRSSVVLWSWLVCIALATISLRAYGWRAVLDGVDGLSRADSQPAKGKVNVDRLNVRARPGTTYEVVAKVVRGQEVTVVGEHGEWLEILPPEGTDAWCSSRYIGPDGRITGNNVRVRSGPGVVFSVFSTLDKGTTVQRIGEPAGEWQKISAPQSATVWIHGQFVDPVSPEPGDGAGENGRQTVGEGVPQPEDAGGEVSAVSDEDESAGLPVLDMSVAVGETSAQSGRDSAPQSENDQGVAAQDNDRVTPSVDNDEGDESDAAAGDEEPLQQGIAPLPSADDLHGPAHEDPVKPEAGQQTVAKLGTLVSLKSKANERASHVLLERRGDQGHLVCYVVSDSLDLTEWENHRVRVYGKTAIYSGWRTEVLHASGIQIVAFPER